MSFANCSTRFESSPARTSDCGEHVDNARTVISSPDATRSTGSPAASYHPHATVLGVGMSWCDRPAGGLLQSSALDAGAPPALDAPVDGAVQAPAIAPPKITAAIARAFIIVSPQSTFTAARGRY